MKNLKSLILIASLFSISFLCTTNAQYDQEGEGIDAPYYDKYEDGYDEPMITDRPINKTEKTIHLNTNHPSKESTTTVVVHDLVGLGKLIKQVRILFESLYPILRPLLILVAAGAGIFTAKSAYMGISQYLEGILSGDTKIVSMGGLLSGLIHIIVAVVPPFCAAILARYLTLIAKTDDKKMDKDHMKPENSNFI